MRNCPKCKNTGLLPLILPDGKKSKYAKLFCECHPIYGEDCYVETQYNHVSIATEGRRPPAGRGIPKGRMHLYIDDFNFPMSWNTYRALCQQHGWNDPGSEYPAEPEPPKEQVIIHRTSSMSKQESDLLQQTALKANYLLKKLNEKQSLSKRIKYE